MNTKYFPSAVQRPQQPENKRCKFVPSAETSHVEVVLLFASASVNRKWLPSGDHMPALPTRSPSRRGEPPSKGTLQSGPIGGMPFPSTTRSSDRSGDMPRGNMFVEDKMGNFCGSPPETDIWAMPV